MELEMFSSPYIYVYKYNVLSQTSFKVLLQSGTGYEIMFMEII